MSKHWKYLKYLLRHKWYVFWACMRWELPVWVGLIHDWSKFLPDEWIPYANHFYGDDPPTQDGTGYDKSADTSDDAFNHAWLLHQKRNPHHWQWWVLPEDEGSVKVLDMPLRYRREMLADWMGAGLAQGHGNDVVPWYREHKDKMQLHPHTRAWIEIQLGVR